MWLPEFNFEGHELLDPPAALFQVDLIWLDFKAWLEIQNTLKNVKQQFTFEMTFNVNFMNLSWVPLR